MQCTQALSVGWAIFFLVHMHSFTDYFFVICWSQCERLWVCLSAVLMFFVTLMGFRRTFCFQDEAKSDSPHTFCSFISFITHSYAALQINVSPLDLFKNIHCLFPTRTSMWWIIYHELLYSVKLNEFLPHCL